MPYFYVLVAIVIRLLPHPWNLTPLGAMFLFSGATFRSKRDSLLMPLAALLLSDYAASRFLYGPATPWFSVSKCIAFLAIGLIGWALRDKITAGRVLGGALSGSLVFFVISNFGVWAGGAMYPLTAAGFVTCYVAALPFFRETLLGDLAYAALLFGSYEWLRRRHTALAAARS